MDSKYSKAFLTLLIIIQLEGISSQGITLYREVSAQEDKYEVSVANCTGSLPKDFVQHISCGNFTVECAQFYDYENCTGNSAEIRRDSVDKLPWKFEKVKSIGPCDTQWNNVCEQKTHKSTQTQINSSSNKNFEPIAIQHNIEARIYLFEHLDFKGPHVVLKLLDKCMSLPRKLKHRVSSIRFDEEVCVQLHESWDCSGTSVRIHRGKPTAINLVDWGFDDRTTSVSLCGYPCPKSVNETKKEIEHSSCEHITLYDERNLTGNSKSISAVNKCINLKNEWEGATESLRLYKKCLMVYTNFGCPESDAAQRKLAFEKVSNSKHNQHKSGVKWRDWLDLREINFDGVIRSIGPCKEDMVNKSQLKALGMALAMFISGISLASCFNCINRKRERRESSVDVEMVKM